MGRRSASLLLVQVALLFVSTIESIITSRILGPEARGLLYVLGNAQVLIITIFSLSIGTSYTVQAAKNQRSVGELINNALVASLLIGGFLIATFLLVPQAYMSTIFRNVEYRWALLVMVIIVPASLFAAYLWAIMLGVNKIVLLTVIGGVTSIVGAAVTIVGLAMFHISITGIVLIWVTNAILTDAVYLYFLMRVERIKLHVDFALLMSSTKFGVTKHLGNSASFLVLRIDTFVLNLLWGATPVGFYSLAISIAERIWFVVGTLDRVSYPLIAAETDNREAVRLTCAVCRHTLFLGVVMSLGIVAVSPLAIHILYTDQFMPAVRPLVLLLPGVIVYQALRTLDAYFTAQLAKPHIPSVIAVITLLASVPTYVFLIKPFGAAGAGLATSVVYCLQAGLAATVFVRMTQSSLVDVALIRPKDLLAYVKLAQATTHRLLKLCPERFRTAAW